MESSISNVYEDELRARAYAPLDLPGTYHVAFRDLPALFEKHIRDTRALDFGCGTGRTANVDVVEFLRPLGASGEGIAWVSETRTAPWSIYVLQTRSAPGLSSL